eukprot:TRINITY_DN155_c0_g1_i15.p1 TRINITY_DN155_c0_g1~~TRINITY_DN155_c0_g1_i15.p1  ORF type:complete len:1016 (+),score=223.12 TRINITY_DN155_c0_g1_i15:263-3310(+)
MSKGDDIYDLKRVDGKSGAEDDSKVLRMSLSSTASASLMDIGDLSAVWNRNDNIEEMDTNISREVEAKYSMGRFMVFKDPQLEDEFMEKFFHAAVRTHRIFANIVFGLLFLFVALYTMRGNFGIVATYGILCVTAIGFHLISKTKEFHQNQVLYVVSFVFLEMTGLGIARFFTDFEEDEVYMLTVSDARYLNVVYLFGHYSSFMSMRLPFKYSLFLDLSIDAVYLIIIGFFPGIGFLDYIENIIFIMIGSIPIAIASYQNELGNRQQEIRRAGILRHTEEVVKEKLVTEKLLLNILPNKIARRLMDGEEIISDGYSQVTVLFADLVGWTEIARSMQPTEAVSLLSEIVGTFDRLTQAYKVEKIKTIGDGYLVGCGLPEPLPAVKSASKMGLFALDMIRAIEGLGVMKNKPLQVTIGIHTGPVVAGVIGKTKFLYDLWGDSVNTASRMQSHGESGKIHVSASVYELLANHFEFEKLAPMEVKGKGMMQTYYLVSKRQMMPSLSSHENIKSAGMDANGQSNLEKAGEVVDEEENVEENMNGKEGESRKSKAAERKRRKAREAMKKRNEELDVLLESKITRVKKIILKFTDDKLEKEFQKLQESWGNQATVNVAILFIGVALFVGPNILQFDDSSDIIGSYYIGVGVCSGVQLMLLGLARLNPSYGYLANIFSVVCLHAVLLCLFSYYRMNLSRAGRFIYQVLQLFQIMTFMSSRIPYRFAVLILGSTFFIFALLSRGLRSQPLDSHALLFYICLMIYGLVTGMQVEKHNRREFLLSHIADEERSKVMKQREESERLLHNILPEAVIDKMKASNGRLIDVYESASVLFADIVGFTVLSSKLDAKSIVTMLNSLFSQFDMVAEEKGLEKIKTIGDAYMVVCGLPYARPDHAKVTVEMGLAMAKIVAELPEIEGLRVNIRIGVHSGSVVGGMVGLSKMVFDIWGENVNVASKMESNGTPGHINVSHVTRQLIGEGQGMEFEDRQKSYHYGGKTYNMFYALSSGASTIHSTPYENRSSANW